MKKTAVFALILFVVVNAFGQTTADEWIARARKHFNNVNYANAITASSEAIKLDSSNLDAYWLRGLSYHYSTGNYTPEKDEFNE
jgi:Flp pilus assembly protein TadD